MTSSDSPQTGGLHLTCVAEYLEVVAGTNSLEKESATAMRTDGKPLDQPSAYHKVQGDSVAKRSSGAWGSRGTSQNIQAGYNFINTGAGNMPHLMPSGQDFFTQLKKQLVSIDQGKPS